MSILRNRSFAIVSMVGLFYGIVLFGTTFILSQFTQTLMGYSAYQSGLILLPRALTILVFMPLVGYFHRNGYGLVCSRLGGFSFFNHLINRQATMLSYNDLSWIFMLFLPNSRAFLKSARKTPLID